MAIAGVNVNTAGAGEVGGYPVIPKGKYETMVPSFEIKTDNGVTSVLLQFLVMEGPHKGHKLTERISLNGTPGAIAFGLRILNSIGKVLGYPQGDWTDAMLANVKGKRFLIDVDIEDARPNGKGGFFQPRNRVNGYEPSALAGGNPNAGMAPATANVAQTGYAPQQMAGGQLGYPQQPQPNFAPPPQQAPQQYAQAPQQAYGAPAGMPQPVQQAQPSLPPQAGYAGAPPPMAAPQQATSAPTWMAGATG
jgi:hypothetical protein